MQRRIDGQPPGRSAPPVDGARPTGSDRRRAPAVRLAGVAAGLALAAAACGSASGETPVETGARGPTTTGPWPSSLTSVTPTSIPTTPLFPLTGYPLADWAPAIRQAVVVKIDNHPDARPHSNLRRADLVYEVKVEGITRFAAVYQSEDADLVGPVRSARTTDVNLLANLNRPILAWSGGNPGVTSAIKAAGAAGFVVDVSETEFGGDFHRDNRRQAPHNLYVSTTTMREKHTTPFAGPPLPMFSYRDDGTPVPPTGIDAAGMTVDFGRSLQIDYVWDAERNGWDRFQVDQSHPRPNDAFVDSDGGQVSPQNVVILSTPYTASAVDSRSPEAQTLGEGDALVLTGGKAIAAHWKRETPIHIFSLTDVAGNPVQLSVGKTWIELPEAGGPPPTPIDAESARRFLARRR